MTIKPLWLSSDAVCNLLNLLVDRLDSADQRGSSRTQSVSVTEKTWPALYNSPFESHKEELWEHVVEMCRWGWLQVKPDTAVRSQSGYASQPRIRVVNEPAVREAVGRPHRLKSSNERWREAVEKHLQASAAVKQAVGEFYIDMPDRSMDEVVLQLNRLPELAEQPLLLREVSARLFWGMSKVLDKRQGLVAAVLGVEECPFSESPIQMLVFLPPGGFEAVLFIENQISFERATRSTSGVFNRLALVFASGFKGSAQRLRTAQSVSIYYSQRGELDVADRKMFETWLQAFGVDLPVYFWGDLDWAGMRILRAMRASFPQLTAWEPGYARMRDRLMQGAGHSPEAADKKGQVPVLDTGCAYTDAQLIPALRAEGKFLDQEFFTL